MSTAAFAGDIGPLGHFETGKGKDAPCAGGTGTCPTPADPSGGDASLTPGPVSVGQDGDPAAQQGHIFVAIGDEGAANSLGRVSFGGSAADGAQLYAEDYTTGDALASAVANANSSTGCNLIAPDPGTTCGQNTGSDSILITIAPPIP